MARLAWITLSAGSSHSCQWEGLIFAIYYDKENDIRFSTAWNQIQGLVLDTVQSTSLHLLIHLWRRSGCVMNKKLQKCFSKFKMFHYHNQILIKILQRGSIRLRSADWDVSSWGLSPQTLYGSICIHYVSTFVFVSLILTVLLRSLCLSLSVTNIHTQSAAVQKITFS